MPSRRLMQLAKELDLAKARYAALPHHAVPIPWDTTGPPSQQYLQELEAAQAAITELTKQIRAAERQVLARCLDLAQYLPEDMHNFTARRELIHGLAALLQVEEQTL